MAREGYVGKLVFIPTILYRITESSKGGSQSRACLKIPPAASAVSQKTAEINNFPNLPPLLTPPLSRSYSSFISPYLAIPRRENERLTDRLFHVREARLLALCPSTAPAASAISQKTAGRINFPNLYPRCPPLTLLGPLFSFLFIIPLIAARTSGDHERVEGRERIADRVFHVREARLPFVIHRPADNSISGANSRKTDRPQSGESTDDNRRKRSAGTKG